MRKRKHMHGMKRRCSPLKTGWDFSKKKDYSPEATEDTFGARLVKHLVPENTPEGILGAVAAGGVLRNAPKIIKTVKAFLNK